jgi:large repetitive protein
LTGTAAQINSALATLSFNPRADFNGTTAFQVSTTDGSLTDTDGRAITITAVADISNDSVTSNEDRHV